MLQTLISTILLITLSYLVRTTDFDIISIGLTKKIITIWNGASALTIAIISSIFLKAMWELMKFTWLNARLPIKDIFNQKLPKKIASFFRKKKI